ncbi:unnamed protein product [Darwinula stevensoni]|uniref:Uncharacterized protein n=1 Tax=Darwinula stevensoni TaxID=69355 RepID=A0A7R9ACW1_9CRUS|nr:unnamed protein product [Darwinula stevensoni]CAG0900467.1 unnamed protein product [Darwinula stevensoni]
MTPTLANPTKRERRMCAPGLRLSWNSHDSQIIGIFGKLWESRALCDVTLACQGGTIRAHKLILSACSPYFQELFEENPCHHPTVVLKDVSYSHLVALLHFIYRGEVEVEQTELQELIMVAASLRIRELTEIASQINLEEFSSSNSTAPPAKRLKSETPTVMAANGEASRDSTTAEGDAQALKRASEEVDPLGDASADGEGEAGGGGETSVLGLASSVMPSSSSQADEDAADKDSTGPKVWVAATTAVDSTTTPSSQDEPSSQNADSEERDQQAHRPHKCQLCGKGFRLRQYLSEHLKRHLAREYTALQHMDLCQSPFLEMAARQLESTSGSTGSGTGGGGGGGSGSSGGAGGSPAAPQEDHSETRPFQCHVCLKAFKRKHHLTDHLRLHTGEKKYRCHYCSESFVATSVRARHITKCHYRPEIPVPVVVQEDG